MNATLQSWARALGGDVSRGGVLCPGPGHGPKDRSLSVKIGKDGEPIVHSFSGDDWKLCRDYVRSRLGMEPFKPNGHAKPAQTAKRTVVESFDYHDPQGAVVYQTQRVEFRNPVGSYVLKDGKHEKTFLLRRPDPDRPGEWISGPGCMAGVTRFPYRLPELLDALAHGRTVAIVEGEGKADLLWKWGISATCNSEGHGSVKNWADHAKYFKAGDQIIVLPDNDQPGRDHVNTVAANLSERGAAIRILDLPGLGPKGDVIDWARAGGTVEKLHALIEHEARPWTHGQAAERAPQKPRMVIEWFAEAADSALSDPGNQLIEGILDEGGLSVIYGDSGSGKTFVALDMAFHIGAGLEWNGKKVRRGLVVYVAAEGGKRIKRRIAALQKRHREECGDVAPDPLFALVRYPIDLRSSDADLKSLLALVREAEKKTGHNCAWLIVDTLSRAMAAGDENSPVDMGRVVATADRFRAETGAHFTYVHHTGKDAARGARGHSLLRAATDTELETTASALTLTKQRDGELGFKIGFKLVDLVIGEDAAGLAVKSAVVEWGAGPPHKAMPATESVPRAQRLLMSVIDAAIDEAGVSFMPFADGPVVRGVKDGIARARYYARIAEPRDDEDLEKAAARKRQAWHRTVKTALDAKGLMAAEHDGERVLWKP
jgi:KaiC/GvpD/RAD55 family RecA-like ATPase